MAITTSVICNSFKKELFEGTHNFKQTGGNSFKLSLYTNSAVLGKSTTSFTTDAQVSNSGQYTSGGGALVNGGTSLSTNTAIVDFANTMFTSMLYQVLKAVCQNSNIYIWTIGNKKEDFNIDSNFIYECNEWKKNMSSSKIKEVFSISNIDLIITPLDPTNRNKNLISKVKKIKSKDKMFVDYNLSGYKQPVLASEIKRFRAAWPFLKQEPLAFLNYIYNSTQKIDI